MLRQDKKVNKKGAPPGELLFKSGDTLVQGISFAIFRLGKVGILSEMIDYLLEQNGLSKVRFAVLFFIGRVIIGS